MVRKERQRSSSPQLAQFSNNSPQLKQASTPLYRTRQPRYTSQHTSGHRQVVRHQLPKLTLAGSSPVARSSKKHKHGTIPVPCFFYQVPGLEPDRVRALSKLRSVCSERLGGDGCDLTHGGDCLCAAEKHGIQTQVPHHVFNGRLSVFCLHPLAIERVPIGP